MYMIHSFSECHVMYMQSDQFPWSFPRFEAAFQGSKDMFKKSVKHFIPYMYINIGRIKTTDQTASRNIALRLFLSSIVLRIILAIYNRLVTP